MEVFARLRDVVVTDVNPATIHRKVSEGEPGEAATGGPGVADGPA